MTRDFTLKKYKQLLNSIGPGNYTVQSYLKNGNQSVILRHDVDRPPKNVAIMAVLEAKIGIKSTYYFRVKPGLFNNEIIWKVKNLGHEVGYHYEVLDKARGDNEKAMRILKKEWQLFKEWGSKTICSHGNPLSPFVNKNIWKAYDLKKFDILGEAYLSIDFNKMKYISDTGRKWNSKDFSIKDKINSELIKIHNTDHLIKILKNREYKYIYILTHPSKWNDLYIFWVKELVWQNIKNVVKKLFLHGLLNKANGDYKK